MSLVCEYIVELEHKDGANLKYSPNGCYISSIHNGKVVIRSASTLKIIEGGVRPLKEDVDNIEWSPDSTLMLCLICSCSTITILSIADPKWDCVINGGVAGLASAVWSPSSREIVSISDFSLFLTVWGLNEPGRSWQLRQPKSGPDFLDFSPNKEFMAVVTRKECRDYLGIYDSMSGEWPCLHEFLLDTLDVASMKWSPSGDAICVLDTSLTSKFIVYGVAGNAIAQYKPYENQLGLEDMQWSSNGTMLAIGSFDQNIHIVTQRGWYPVAELQHLHPKKLPKRLDLDPPECLWEFPSDPVIAKEYRHTGKLPKIDPSISKVSSGVNRIHRGRGKADPVDEENQGPPGITFHCEFPSVFPTPNKLQKEETDTKIKYMSWSPDSRYIATVCQSYPRVLFLWDVETFSMKTCILFMRPILKIQWCEGSSRLAIATGSHRLYLWSSDGIHWLDVPLRVAKGTFRVLDFELNPAGDMVMLLSKDRKLCVTLGTGKIEENEVDENSLSN